MAVLWALAALLALLVLLLLALLLLPLDMYVRLDPDLHSEEAGGPLGGTMRWRLQLRWGWGLFRTWLAGSSLSVEQGEVRLLGIRWLRWPGRKEARPQAKPPQRVRPAKAKPRRRRRRLPLAVMRALIQEGLQLMARTWRDLGLQVHGDVIYGLPDPALTGLVEIFLRAGPLPSDLQVEPDWLDPRLEGWVQVQGHLFAVKLLIALLAVLKNRVLRQHLLTGLKANLSFRKIFLGGRVS